MPWISSWLERAFQPIKYQSRIIPKYQTQVHWKFSKSSRSKEVRITKCVSYQVIGNAMSDMCCTAPLHSSHCAYHQGIMETQANANQSAFPLLFGKAPSLMKTKVLSESWASELSTLNDKEARLCAFSSPSSQLPVKLREMQFSSVKKTFFPKQSPAAEEDEDSTVCLESQSWDTLASRVAPEHPLDKNFTHPPTPQRIGSVQQRASSDEKEEQNSTWHNCRQWLPTRRRSLKHAGPRPPIYQV